MPSERRLNGLQRIMHLLANIDGSEYNLCGHYENMHAIMDERYAQNGMILILECRYAGQPDLKIMTPPSPVTHDSCSMIPRTPVGIRCEHTGIMQRTDDKGIIQHMPFSKPRRFPVACRALKTHSGTPCLLSGEPGQKAVFRMISYEHRNADFDSDGDFMCFMRNASKTGFSVILIKTLVHRAQNIRLCGRHRFSAFNRFAISC